MVDICAFPSPCFILDEARLRHNLSALQHIATQANIDILHALKGFALWHVFPLIGQYLNGAATSSVHEAQLVAQHMGCKVDHYSVAYHKESLRAIVPYAQRVIFNSLQQYHALAHLTQHLSCGLRLNPQHQEVKTPCYDPSAPTSRLGIDTLDALPAGVQGIHVHALCENDSYALERLLQVIEQKYAALLPQIAWLNLGGGHLITADTYDKAHLIELLLGFSQKYPHLRLILEPSAAVVWNSGVLKTTILDIVTRSNITTAIIDASFTCHMPDCLEMPYTPRIQQAATEPTPHVYRMGGMSCLAGDWVGDYYFEKPLQIGDVLVFEDMMHYTFVRSTYFNGVQHPAVGIWREDQTAQLCRTFDYQDYQKHMG